MEIINKLLFFINIKLGNKFLESCYYKYYKCFNIELLWELLKSDFYFWNICINLFVRFCFKSFKNII